MDRTYRQDMLKTAAGRGARAERCSRTWTGEYSLSEIAIITRAGPARMLGLKHKGHLGVGADADVTIYTPDANAETMFAMPRFVIKAGRVLVEQGEIREEVLRQDAARRPRVRPRGRGRHPGVVRGSVLDPMAELSGRGRRASRNPK